MPHSLGFVRTNKQKVYKKGVSLATWAGLELEVLGQAAFQRTPHGNIKRDIKYEMGPTVLVREGMVYCGDQTTLLLGISSSSGACLWGSLAPPSVLATCEAQLTIKVHKSYP